MLVIAGALLALVTIAITLAAALARAAGSERTIRPRQNARDGRGPIFDRRELEAEQRRRSYELGREHENAIARRRAQQQPDEAA